MLQQIRIPKPNIEFGGFGPDADSDTRDVRHIRADVYRLVAARYFILLMGVGLVAWLGIQAYVLGESISLLSALRVITVAIMGPGLAWLASDKELRLLRVVDRRNSEIEQRVRENLALNRMTQEHLAECFGKSQPASHVKTMLPEQAGSGLDQKFGPKLRPDIGKVVVMETDDHEVDHRYFEAAKEGNREIFVN
ncbi:MAG: hypothetical protein IIC99_07650 [Chloroflexi bacterium]|nr:hypothetical protein [Chloroflexota bacterium]